MREVLVHPLHELCEAAESHSLYVKSGRDTEGESVSLLGYSDSSFNSWKKHRLTIIQDDEEGSQQVTHTLDITDLQVLPDVAVKIRTR